MPRTIVSVLAALALTVSNVLSAPPPATAQTDPIPVERIAGSNRYTTATKVAQAWPSGVPRVYIVGGSSYRDGLIAAGRAGVFRSPILLAKQDSLPSTTRDALKRLSPRRIVVVGGPASVADSVLRELAPLAGSEGVERVSDADRYTTAAQVAGQYRAGRPAALLVNGKMFPNASIGALSASQNLPVVLTRGDGLDPVTKSALERLRVGEVIVIGSTSKVSDRVAREAAATTSSGSFRRISGSDNYSISQSLAKEFPPGGDPAYVASGESFPGALYGAALAGRDNVPMILTVGDTVLSSTASAVARQAPDSLVVIGGTDVVSESVVARLAGGESSAPYSSGPAISTGAYNGMGGTDDQQFLNLVGGMPLTHATSYYNTGSVDDTWPNARDWQRKSDGVIVQMGMASKNWRKQGDRSFMAWRDIAAGKHDAEIRSWGRKLAAFDSEVWFAFDIEPDQKLNHGRVPTNWTPEEYAAAARRISQIVRSEAPKVKYTFWVAGHQKGLIDRMYPGDAAVDIICWDPYVHRAKSPDITPYQLWSGFSDWLDTRSWGQGKPRGLCETGFHNEHPDAKGAKFWQQAPDAARRLDLAFVTYFHRNSGPIGHFTMEDMPQTRKAYATAMRELQN